MTQISGTIEQAPDVLTHESPQDLREVQAFHGETKVLLLGDYRNTGNVSQTLTLSASNLQNVESASFYFTNGEGKPTATISAGSAVTAYIELKMSNNYNQPFSLIVVDTWAKA